MSQLIKNLVDVSEYANDGKKLFDENPTPIELKYRIVRGKHILDNADMPTQVSNSVSIFSQHQKNVLV